MDKPKSPSVVAFWQEFRRLKGVPEQAYDVCKMGDNPALADESLALILAAPNVLPPACCTTSNRAAR